MLSNEEKKAIEQFKNFVFTYQDVIEDEYSDYEEKECAKEYQEVSEKIINLIEKQSKEIEEQEDFIKKLQATKDRLDKYDKENTLIIEKQQKEIEELKEKNEYLPSWVNRKYISKDKIEAKIEEKFLEAKGLHERGVQPQAQYTMKLLRDLEKSLLEKE